MGGAGRGTVLGPDEGALIELPGWRMRIKVSASDTAGAMTILEARMDGGHAGPAEHIHIGQDEAFFVISGLVARKFVRNRKRPDTETAPAGPSSVVVSDVR